MDASKISLAATMGRAVAGRRVEKGTVVVSQGQREAPLRCGWSGWAEPGQEEPEGGVWPVNVGVREGSLTGPSDS